MKPSQYTALILVIIVAWASIFITVLDQNKKLRNLVSGQQTQLNNDSVLLKNQKKTIDILSGKINDLTTHVDCLFNLATHPAGSRISEASTCAIVTPTPAKPAPTPTPSPTPAPSSANNSSNNGNNNPPKSKPLVCKLTLGALGC